MSCAWSLVLLLPLAGVAHAQAPALPTPPPKAASDAAHAPAAATPAAPAAATPAAPAAATPAAPARPDKAAPAKTASSRHRRRRHKVKPPPPPAAELYAINTHETYHLRPDKHGRFTRAALRGWNRFLRCHHTGRVHPMSSHLAQLIYDVDKHFGFKRILVVAGYRAPRVAREKGNPKSPHKKGVACDFRIDGVTNEELRDYERTLPHVGVGYYPNSDFVHLDVDPMRKRHSAFWIDYSGPGERARYAKNPYLVLQREKEQEEGDDELAPLPGANGAAGTNGAAGINGAAAGANGAVGPNAALAPRGVVGAEPQGAPPQGAPAPNAASAVSPTAHNH